jgi:hypothetical protein
MCITQKVRGKVVRRYKGSVLWKTKSVSIPKCIGCATWAVCLVVSWRWSRLRDRQVSRGSSWLHFKNSGIVPKNRETCTDDHFRNVISKLRVKLAVDGWFSQHQKNAHQTSCRTGRNCGGSTSSQRSQKNEGNRVLVFTRRHGYTQVVEESVKEDVWEESRRQCTRISERVWRGGVWR